MSEMPLKMHPEIERAEILGDLKEKSYDYRDGFIAGMLYTQKVYKEFFHDGN